MIKHLFSVTAESVVEFLRKKGVLKRSIKCSSCQVQVKTVKYSRNKDNMAFRCYNTKCVGYKKYRSIRIESFLDRFTLSLIGIVKIAWKWFNNHTPRFKFAQSLISQPF